ncbi:DnaJ domain-containing protein [Patescibacteria group bacterium]|nr:DnaJ domain-containing protein [Patescibacteria group bacterium]
MEKDYYQILGVNKSASQNEIKTSYRKLAHKYHPDKAGGNEKKFKEINEAYQVLSNKEKRGQYDQFGKTFDNMGQGGGFNYAGGNPFGGFGFDFGGSRQKEDFDINQFGNLGDIFETFFGGGRKKTSKRRGADLEIIQEITLEESFQGANKQLIYNRFSKCKNCSGLGYIEKDGLDKCSNCEGSGEIREIKKTFFGQFAQTRICSKCNGLGQIPKKLCPSCSSSGKIQERKTLNFNIIAGIDNEQIIKIAEEGEVGEKGGPSGDLYIIIKIKPHSIFQRIKNDLYIEKSVSLTNLLLKKKIEIPTISGNKINIEIPDNFCIQEKLLVPNEGMSRLESRGRGNLFIKFKTKTPKKINSKAKKLLEELEKEI